MIIKNTLWFILVVSTLNIAYADSSQTPATKTASEKEAAALLETLNMGTILDQTIEQMLDIQLKQNPKIVPYKPVMMKFFKKHMSYESLKPDMVKIYADAFTEQELKELNAFYKTPTGQKTLIKMPELMRKGAEIGSKRVQDNMAELQAMIRAEAQRLNSQKEPAN